MVSADQIALGCHLGATALIAAFGLTYATRSEFMPYHAAALQKSWAEVEPTVKVLVLALMKAIGGLCFAVVLLEFALLLIPFRQGAVWAQWVVPLGGLAVTGASLYGMSYVARHTPARPPWALPVAGGSLYVIGLCASLL